MPCETGVMSSVVMSSVVMSSVVWVRCHVNFNNAYVCGAPRVSYKYNLVDCGSVCI